MIRFSTTGGIPGFKLNSTNGLQFRPLNGITPPGHTFFVRDATPGTGQTGVIFEAGPNQSTFDIFTVQANGGGSKFLIVTASGDVQFGPSLAVRQSATSTNVWQTLRADLKMIGIMSDHVIKWAQIPTGNFFSTSVDTGIARSAPGVVEANNGTIGTLRDFKCRNLFTALPVSAAGLASGQLWNNGGVVNVAP